MLISFLSSSSFLPAFPVCAPPSSLATLPLCWWVVVGLGDREPRNEQLKQSATTHRRRCRAVLFHCPSATLQMVVGTQMAICPVKTASSAVQYKKRKRKKERVEQFYSVLLEHTISFAAQLRLSEHIFKYRPCGHCTVRLPPPVSAQSSFHLLCRRGKRWRGGEGEEQDNSTKPLFWHWQQLMAIEMQSRTREVKVSSPTADGQWLNADAGADSSNCGAGASVGKGRKPTAPQFTSPFKLIGEVSVNNAQTFIQSVCGEHKNTVETANKQ